MAKLTDRFSNAIEVFAMHDRCQHRWLLCLIAASAICWAAGCGNGNLVAVEGRVTVDGKPADDGSIVFNPVDRQGPSKGVQIKDGKYQFTGGNRMLPGEKNVEIVATLKTGKQLAAGPPLPKGTMVDEVEKSSSKETRRITLGQSEPLDFDLKRTQKR
jgi:hypothetical protein